MHDLERELTGLVKLDDAIFAFIQSKLLDGLWYQDLHDTEKEWINDRFWHELGYSAAEAESLRREDQVHPDDLEREKAALRSQLNSDDDHYDETVRYRHQDGSTVWMRCRGVILHDAAGSATKRLIAVQNISPLKRVEQQLLSEKDRYEVAVNGANVGIWDWEDVSTGRVFWNRQFYNLLGHEEQDFPSSFEAFEERLHPEDREATLNAVESHLKENTPYDVEYRLKVKAGHYRWFHAVGSAVRDENGVPLRMAGSIEDIHDRKLAEKESANLLVRLTESNKDLEQFAYAASHDLQEPLRIISSYLGLIKRRFSKELPNEALDLFSVVEDGCARMKNLILDLLSYSRIKRHGENLERFDVSKLIQNIIKGFETDNPDVTFNLDLEDGAFIEGIQSYIDRLIINLIGNAVKYRDPDRALSIKVSTKIENSYLILNVADNGIGIEQEYFERIFKVFQRLHTITEYPGTGIGLAICKRIVEIHGGSINVDSVFGQGTTFIVRLPVHGLQQDQNE